jgi:hypothetical protein
MSSNLIYLWLSTKSSTIITGKSPIPIKTTSPDMRRPFIIFLFVLIAFCWLKDCADFLFYLFGYNSPNVNLYSVLIGLLALVAIFYIAKKTVFKHEALPSAKEIFQPERKKEWWLLWLVSTPIILLGLFRCIYPDLSFDTAHYELNLQDTNFSGEKLNAGLDAIRAYFFPLSEKVFGLFRHLLGYRLGAIFTTFLFVTIIFSSYDFLKRFFSEYSPTAKPATILLACLAAYTIFADNTFLLISSYKTDILGVPFLQELLFMLFFGGRFSKKTNFFIFYLIASLVITLKLTYLPFAAIIGLAYYIKNFKHLPRAFLFFIPFIVLLFPSLYMLYNRIETGNPLYPLFNHIFKSPLYPIRNFVDTRWQPKTLIETLFFHIYTLMDNSRCNEWALYSYRLLFGSFISLACILYYLISLVKKRNNLFFQQLAFLALISILLDYSCTISTGYYRYGIIIEVCYGLIIASLLLYLKKNIITALIAIAITFQLFFTFKHFYVQQYNLSFHDYASLLQNNKLRNDNISRIFHDYDGTLDNNERMPKVDAFVSLDPCMLDSWARLLNNKVPVYNLEPSRPVDLVNKLEKEVVRVQSQSKNVMLLAHTYCVQDNIVNTLNKRAYQVTDMYEIHPNFMRANQPLFLFKIKDVDTGKFTINTTTQIVDLEASTDTSGNRFSYHSDKKVKIFIREAPFYFDWDYVEAHDLYINDKKYTITGESKFNQIYTLDTNKLILRSSKPISYLVIIQEIQDKPAPEKNN